jgi:hypothetical protein
MLAAGSLRVMVHGQGSAAVQGQGSCQVTAGTHLTIMTSGASREAPSRR